MNDKEYLDKLRHSAAHLLAAAVMELYPEAKRTIGPSIENGFYFDFDFGNVKLSENDLPKIEKRMNKLAPHFKSFKKHELTSSEAKNEYPDNEYKHELIDEFTENGKKKVSFYESVGLPSKSSHKIENYWDLCKGGHVEEPSKELKHFKLLKVAGAYWHGDEKNTMLTRIYGTAFSSQDELDNYLHQLEEAKLRDHKKLGPQLDLYMFHETSPGMPYWLPKGLVLYNELVKYWRDRHNELGYKEIASPLLNKSDLYVTSGHWEHYKEDMFIANMGENEVYGVKPMNCPNAMIVFGSKTRSYKDLPYRLSDTDRLHRYELSGTLNGLLRARSFQQDDAHNYITEDMIGSEFQEIFAICDEFYSIFGLKYRFRFGTRPEKFMGDPRLWDKAEVEVEKALKKSGVEYYVELGDGAFYGPKVDIVMKDALGRDWQMGTIQLDFQQPLRFKLKYVDNDGSEKTPAVIHRVIYGSLERFIGIIVEHFAGAFPVWLSPVQVKVLPITDRNIEYSMTVGTQLKESGIRLEVDESSETLGNKIRKAQEEKVPYMVIIGDKEEADGKLAVRLRDGSDIGKLEVNELSKHILGKVVSKALDL